MLRTLRELNPAEMRKVAAYCNSRPGATPEEIIASLCKVCGVAHFGVFPARTYDALLAHVSRRLGMEPLPPSPRSWPVRERQILAAYLRYGWDAADLERRWAVLEQAVAAWDDPLLPCPALPLKDLNDPAQHTVLYTVFDGLLRHPAGCRALAAATETDPLPLLAGLPGSRRLSVLGMGDSGHHAMYGVLQVLWRARGRLLRVRRLQKLELEQQLRQYETLRTARRKNLDSTPPTWIADPRSGLSVAAAAGASWGLHMAFAGTAALSLLPAFVVGVGGVAWAASALAFGPRAGADRRLERLHSQIQQVRQHLAILERDIRELEGE